MQFRIAAICGGLICGLISLFAFTTDTQTTLAFFAGILIGMIFLLILHWNYKGHNYDI